MTNNLEGSLSRIDVEDLTVEARTLDKERRRLRGRSPRR